MRRITITVIMLFFINMAFSQQWSIGGRFGFGWKQKAVVRDERF